MNPADKKPMSPPESPPPPPPPPTPSSMTECDHESIPEDALCKRETMEQIRQMWAARKKPGVRVFASIHYTNVEPILQDGPTCGIVALAMISSVLTNYTARDILQIAINKEYTLKGEMFNASDMFLLVHAVVGEFFDIKMITNGLKGKERKISKDLVDGALYLVPYDADIDDSPGLFSGHRAHWALLCGVIEEEGGKLIILARQGRSKHVSLWTFDELCLSNANLTEISPLRLTEGGYKVHNISKTLAGHAIRLKPKQL